MKKVIFALVWVVSLGAAYFLGRFVAPVVVREVEIVREVPVQSPVSVAPTPAVATAAKADAAVDGSSAAVDTAAGLEKNGVVAFVSAGERKISTTSDASSVMRTKDAVERARAFARLRDGMTAENSRTILEMFLAKGFSTPREEEEIRMLAESWAAIDGKSAVDFLNGIDHSKRPENTIRASLAEWAMKDPDAAEAWARGATTNQPNYYMIGIISGAANVDVARAERLLYEMPYGRARGEAMQYVAGAHLERGLSDAMNWATSVPDPRLEQAAIRRVAAQVAVQNPRQAADWVLANSNEEQMQYNITEVSRQWSYSSAEDAANWAFALPKGPAHDAAVAAVLPRLAETKPALVESLLLQYPASRGTDSARLRIARNYTESDPVRALAWANTVSDRRVRDDYTRRIAESWSRRDPAAAAAFLQPKTQ